MWFYDLRTIRTSSLLLTAVLLAVVGAVGARYMDNPLLAVAWFFVGTIIVVTVGGLVWFVVGWRADMSRERLRHERRRNGQCELCGQRLRETDETCIGCGALVLHDVDPRTGRPRPLG